ncbi:integrase/recombinase XerD [Rhodococcus wratislaviensis]|uniref:Tyrosine recombinase n=1 Tax=Rhodococcus wratislaviensis TaxID=44752 RepID=A0AB38FKP5_RHOWR|nr:tyrosine-type recombinase/integrase [Rhodococcus wratislaviensis]REE74387.1 integrase/recombinase XerD [Rhodococcus wratislaviensis]SPZ42076.1 tyrosine recombinase [Rhodococcus wratislaviensis]
MTTTERKRPGPAPTPVPENWRPWVDLFVSEQSAARRRAETIRTRVHHLRKLAYAVPQATPLTITRADLVAYTSAQSWSPHTAHSNRATFRVFFRLLCELGHRSDDPARTLPQVRLPRSRPRPCPDHVVRQAFAGIADPKVVLALRIAVETGLRRAEIAQAKPGDVEGRPGDYALHVVGKGGHERTVPISDDLAGAILECRTVHLFPDVLGGGHLTPRHLGKLISRALPGDWTTHTLRHRFATMAYQAGGDLRAVQELMGHTSPVTTAIYTKVADDSMRSAASAARIDYGGDR